MGFGGSAAGAYSDDRRQAQGVYDEPSEAMESGRCESDRL